MPCYFYIFTTENKLFPKFKWRNNFLAVKTYQVVYERDIRRCEYRSEDMLLFINYRLDDRLNRTHLVVFL